MSKDTSGPAFPMSIPAGHYWSGEKPNGMSLRQWYAGLAMQGLVASGALTVTGEWHIRPFNEQEVSDQAFAMADAMIAEGSQQ